MNQTRKSPAAGTNRAQKMHHHAATRYPAYRNQHSNGSCLPDNWHSRLPAGLPYYQKHVKGLKKPNAGGWMVGRCPFHDDKAASFAAHQVHGGWRCFAGCGSGDLVDFHRRFTGRTFIEAVRDLIGEVSHG